MTHLGLFEGIGGFSLAAKWMGWRTLAWCEWNPFCQKVLRYHFPDAKEHSDIRNTDFSVYRGEIDIITGGFPCQPYSLAGKRKGKEDERHLWPEMLRAIREVQPRWVVGENVFGIVNWNKGLVFEEVQAQLETEGYEVQPFILPACAVNAPHRRDRVWFIANLSSKGLQKSGQTRIRQFSTEVKERLDNRFEQHDSYDTDTKSDNQQRNRLCKVCKQGSIGGCDYKITSSNSSDWGSEFRYSPEQDQRQKPEFGECFEQGASSNTLNMGLQRHEFGRTPLEGKGTSRPAPKPFEDEHWFEAATRLCIVDDGLSGRLDSSSISKGKWRTESLKAAGNAIVPQVAYQIYKAIQEYEKK